MHSRLKLCLLIGAITCVSILPLIAPAGLSNSITSKGVVWRDDSAQITVENREVPHWTYELSTTAELRDGFPAAKRIRYSEREGSMVLRTGNDLFDGLFALAIHEVKESRADQGQIRDPSFNFGQAVKCDCFETGRMWRYVWTRDTAFAVQLGLGLIDPRRARNSLLFKISDRREGEGQGTGKRPEIVQDTGSGGSWPVSTDRVVWAYGAWEVLKYLDGAERTRFRDRAYEAISNTLETDRKAVLDPKDGLYRGEHSFLDWREQVYPEWTREDTLPIGISKSLTTNLLHARAMEVASALAAEKGLAARSEKYSRWSRELNAAIARTFWDESRGLYRNIKPPGAPSEAVQKFDLLGESLSVLFGAADEASSRRIAENYPHTAAGAPVIWPQQPMTAIYHNRAIWPFVSAYWIRAARAAENDAVFNHNLDSMVRGAALNLSNMENFEFLTQANYSRDGDLSGPVVNSHRQLWSVAGYLSMVLEGVFGLDATQKGIRFRPFLTGYLRNHYFGASESIKLHGLRYRGKWIDVELLLPPADQNPDGFYVASEIRVNGRLIDDAYLESKDMKDLNQWEIRMMRGSGEPSAMRIQGVDRIQAPTRLEFESIWSPKEPRVSGIEENAGKLAIRFDANGEREVIFRIYRNGVKVASHVPAGLWVDEGSSGYEARALCYSVEAEYTSSGNRSHRSRPVCRAAGGGKRFSVEQNSLRSPDHASIEQRHGKLHFNDWGRPRQVLETGEYRAERDGLHSVSVEYGNARGPINTGITAAVKFVEITDQSSGKVVGSGVVFMPHLPSWGRWANSSVVEVPLVRGASYTIRVRDYANMSYFSHFALYTGGAGGIEGPINRANISAVSVSLAPQAH